MQKIAHMLVSLDMRIILPVFLLCLAGVIFVARRGAKIKDCIKDADRCYWQAQEAQNEEARQKAYDQMITHYSLAVKMGSSEAITRMGHVYREGWGVEQDLTQAYKYYLKGARKSFHEAQYHLSLLYETGQGCELNLKKAKHWRQRSQSSRLRLGF